MPNSKATIWIEEKAKQLGFARCGVVCVEEFPELARSGEWVERGYAGEMKYLADPRRKDPHSVMAGIRSVIVCALPYNTKQLRTSEAFHELRNENYFAEPRGWISRYAWGDDYHEVLRAKLEAMCEELRRQFPEPFDARVYTDTGPINERIFAKYGGLGWLGKNTLLLNEKLGSYFFLGVILTTLDLQPTLGTAEAPPADRCGTCRKCIDACPTNALVEPYLMDARKCISYLTIELCGTIPEELREPMGQHIFGCDICQDVCPWNRDAPITEAKEFQPRIYEEVDESLYLPRLEWLASTSETEFRELFRKSPLKRTKWRGLVRNVCIALGNSSEEIGVVEQQAALEILGRLEECGDTVVAESARWAISRIQGSDSKPPEVAPEIRPAE